MRSMSFERLFVAHPLQGVGRQIISDADIQVSQLALGQFSRFNREKTQPGRP
jgi:hypothetical protein